jgi:hypothetical protein
MGLFFSFINFMRLKMQSSIIDFFNAILAVYLSGVTLHRQGFLKGGEDLLCLSHASRRFLFGKLAAEKQANLNPKQRQKLILFRLRAVVMARLLGKQSWQHCPIGIPPNVLRHLMTMGIPRQIMIRPIVNPQVSKYQDILNLFRSIPRKLVVRDLTGDQYSVQTAYELSIGILTVKLISRNAVHMTRHPTKNFMAMICEGGKVWIQKSDDQNNLFHLIHDAEFSQIDRACTSEFHPSNLIIAIGVIGSINIIEFSPSLDSFKLMKKIPFGEKPNFFNSFAVNFWVTQIQWHPSETYFTAISHSGSSGLAKSFLLDERFDVRNQANCAYTGTIAPSCLFFSPDGNFAVTGYSNGLLSFWRVINQGNELTFEILKSDCVLAEGCRIKKIQFFPQDDSILAIQTSSKKSGAYDDVYIVKISKSFDVKILQTIYYLSHFDIYGDFLLIQARFSIIIYILKSDNLPVKMTEFESQDGPIGSCLLTTENGKVMLYYSYVGRPELHKAALEFK